MNGGGDERDERQGNGPEASSGITPEISASERLLCELTPQLLDPLALELANHVEWWHLPGLSKRSEPKTDDNQAAADNDQTEDPYPIAITGKGSPLLMLHGFDSSFLEFRRLAPLLQDHHQLFIPDLHGFGFCPRPKDADYGNEAVLNHLSEILAGLDTEEPIGMIGASMGGAIAMELARRHPKQINRLLLLAPAGLTGRPMPIPAPLDKLGVWFLSRPGVRRGLCRQAFADPNSSVGKAEEQIASLHLQVPGWGRALAAFARSGGFANCGQPLPRQPVHGIWGANDRILKGAQKRDAVALLESHVEELKDCGHLPHLDHPKFVANRWLEGFRQP
ncbi:MAG: Lipase 3 [Prochlorococcus marinus str. MIT 9215]|nr:MAG: Lipase 3 [Prochlorococcus marinus str. MIT 9215]